MNIGEVILGFLAGGGIGGGAFYFLQKSRISEVAQRYKEEVSKTRQALDGAEAELKEKKSQNLALSQSEEKAKKELQNLEATYQSNLEQIEHSYQIQMEENSVPVNASPELEAELERANAQILNYQGEIEAYKTQIFELNGAIAPSDDSEQATQARIQEVEQHYQTYIEELQQTYQHQLQDIETSHQADLQEQQHTHQTQFQEIEQAYQNQIVELGKTHQTQIWELEQAYQSQMLELQQEEPLLSAQATPPMMENPVETVQPTQFTEPWDEDFSKATFVETAFTEEEESIAQISSLEELADLTRPESDEPEAQLPVRSREQDDFFASQTLIGDMGFAESMHLETEEPPVRSREQDDFFASQTLIGDMGFAESMHLETEEPPVRSREQDDFFASQTLISDADFLESLQSDTQEFNLEDLADRSELESENLELEDFAQSSDDLFHSQTLIGEMDFLESLELDVPNPEYSSKLEDMAMVSEDFFVSEHSDSENNLADLLPTSEEMTADGEELFTLESNNPFDLEDQSVDLDLFDPFETPKSSEIDLDDVKGMHTNSKANGSHKPEFEAYHPDADLDFFDMLEKNHSETPETLEIDDDINIDDLFSEELFHSEWESSPKN